MDELPYCLLLHILSRLDDSADVARCRVASKAFNTVFPGLRTINIRWYCVTDPSKSPQRIKPFQTAFLNLISILETVESVSISLERPLINPIDYDADFGKQWLPRVSGSLKSLSLADPNGIFARNVFVFKYCHNLVNLELKDAWLFAYHVNTMPMLTSLTLEGVSIEDEVLNKMNKCLPNVQVLNLVNVRGLRDPKINLFNLKTCVWEEYGALSLTFITPNLITLPVKCHYPNALHIEAPMLSQFHLDTLAYKDIFLVTNFENLKTLCLKSFDIGSLLLYFPMTKTLETLTMDSKHEAPKYKHDFKLTLGNVFIKFPNVTSLYINYGTWWELEAWFNRQQGCEVLDGTGLKFLCAYLKLDDPLLTFRYVACVLDQCVGLSEVSFLIHSDFIGTVFEGFMSKCMDHWPGLKWRWGIWREYMKDSWITDDGSSIKHHNLSKKQHLC